MCDVSVIIVNYNTKELSTRCIDSVVTHTQGITYEVILIDNASQDDSLAFLETRYKDNTHIQIIGNKENIGFGRACNIGISMSQADYIYLLNPDAFLENNAMKFYVDFMAKNQNKKIGALGSHMYDEYGNPQHSFGSFRFMKKDIRRRLKKVLVKNIIPPSLKEKVKRKRKKTSQSSIPLQSNRSVDYITGANLFIPKKVLREIGLFDPDYFMYSEEVDLQYRMQKENYSRIVISTPRIIHLQGESFESKKANSRRIMAHVGKLIFIKKHHTAFVYYAYKSLFSMTLLIQVFSDLLSREYTWSENIKFLKSYIHETFI